MYKSVKTYLDAVKAADEEQKARDAAVLEKYNADYQAARGAGDYAKQEEVRVWQRAENSASSKLRNAQEAVAWAQLGFANEPAVAWIARNCEGYKEHARIVLRALKSTSTAKQMRALARRSSWCGTFDELLLKAKHAGVFADETSPERLEMIRWFQNNLSSSGTYLVQLEEFMDKIMDAESAAYVAKLTAEAAGVVTAAEVAPEVEAAEEVADEAAPADERELVAA